MTSIAQEEARNLLIEHLNNSQLHWKVSAAAARHIAQVTPIVEQDMEVEDSDALG